jgi:hypothetical protein
LAVHLLAILTRVHFKYQETKYQGLFIERINKHIQIRKACAFSASFDLLKVLDLPFDVQIYAWKTHAENVSVHKTMLEHHLILFKTCLGFSTNQDLAFYAIIYVCCLSVVLCHRQIFVYILIIVDFLFIAFSAPLYPKERQMCYFKICLLSTFSSTVICWMAI